MTARIPLFPLGTVLVPGQALPLHIFEPRYRQLVSDLLARPETDRVFGVIGIREGHEVGEDAVRALYPVGTLARLDEADRHPDGRYDIVTIGERRFALGTIHDHRPYATADVEWLEEAVGDDAPALAPAVRESLETYLEVLESAGILIEHDDPPHDPRGISYAVARTMVLDLADRQALLECPDDSARLRAGLALLRRESTLAELLPSLPAGDLARTAVSLN